MHKDSRLWNIIQAASGVYCAIFGTYTYYNPRPAVSASAQVQSPPGGSTVNISIWLTVGLIALGLSVAVPALVRLFSSIFESRKRLPLTIRSAFYGTGPENDLDVAATLQGHVHRGALSVIVSNNLFGHDPVEGHPKRINVEYALGNAIRTTTRPEGQRLTLPEDPWLLQQIQQSKAPPKSESTETVKNGPHLLVNYGGGLRQTLTFINDGKATAIIKSVSPLSWSEQRTITLFSPVSPIPPGDRAECQFHFETAPSTGGNLYEFMRSETGENTDTHVVVTFEDTHGDRYSQRFDLTTAVNKGVIVWSPGPVRRVSVAEAL